MLKLFNTSSNEYIIAIISKFEVMSLLIFGKDTSKYNLISISDDDLITDEDYKKFNSYIKIYFQDDIDDITIKKIIEFSKKDNLIIHCDAGESRSAAVAMAITYIKCIEKSNCKMEEFIKNCSILQNDRYTPNMAIFSKIVNYYKEHYLTKE